MARRKNTAEAFEVLLRIQQEKEAARREGGDAPTDSKTGASVTSGSRRETGRQAEAGGLPRATRDLLLRPPPAGSPRHESGDDARRKKASTGRPSQASSSGYFLSASEGEEAGATQQGGDGGDDAPTPRRWRWLGGDPRGGTKRRVRKPSPPPQRVEAVERVRAREQGVRSESSESSVGSVSSGSGVHSEAGEGSAVGAMASAAPTTLPGPPTTLPGPPTTLPGPPTILPGPLTGPNPNTEAARPEMIEAREPFPPDALPNSSPREAQPPGALTRGQLRPAVPDNTAPPTAPDEDPPDPPDGRGRGSDRPPTQGLRETRTEEQGPTPPTEAPSGAVKPVPHIALHAIRRVGHWLLGDRAAAVLRRPIQVRLSTALALGLVAIITTFMLSIYYRLPSQSDMENSREVAGGARLWDGEVGLDGSSESPVADDESLAAGGARPLWSPETDTGDGVGSANLRQAPLTTLPEVRTTEDDTTGTVLGAAAADVNALAPKAVFLIQVRANANWDEVEEMREYFERLGYPSMWEPDDRDAEPGALYTFFIGREFRDKDVANKTCDRLKQEVLHRRFKRRYMGDFQDALVIERRR